MGVSWGQVRQWHAAPLETAGNGLHASIDQIMRLDDDLAAHGVAPSWQGQAADAAAAERRALSEKLEDLITEVSVARRAVLEAADVVGGIERSVTGVESFAAAKGLSLSDDGRVDDVVGATITYPSAFAAAEGNQARQDLVNQCLAEMNRILTEAGRVDEYLSGALGLIQSNWVAGLDAPTVQQAAMAAEGFGADDGHKYHLGPPAPPDITYRNDFPYDPNASPTLGDYASYEKWQLKLDGAKVLRPDLDDATDAYAHYLDHTGTDLRVDYEEAYAEDNNVRKVVDNEILTAGQEAERIYRETGQTSFHTTGNARWVGKEGYPSTENWQKTLGDHVVYGTSQVTVQGDQMTMKVIVHAEDRYNFNRDAADIATGAPDDDNGRFATLGWAKEFRTHGEVERTVTWTIGDTPGMAATGGQGPDRNAPGEDRVDGRSDG